MRRLPTHARPPSQVQSTERRSLGNGHVALKPHVGAGPQREDPMRATTVATAVTDSSWEAPYIRIAMSPRRSCAGRRSVRRGAIVTHAIASRS